MIHQTKDLPQQLGVRSVADLADQFPAPDGNDWLFGNRLEATSTAIKIRVDIYNIPPEVASSLLDTSRIMLII